MRALAVGLVAVFVALTIAQDPVRAVYPGTNGKIAFESSRSGFLDIYAMNSDGTGLVQLTNSPDLEGQPAWSPDGSRIAYHSLSGGNVDIYVMNADGSGKTRLTTHPSEDASPSWSPDGMRIAFDSHRDGNYEIYAMNATGIEQTRLTNSSGVDAFPAWSPDGSRIAFQSDRGASSDIFVMNTDGSAQTNITNSPRDDYVPDWSPDGTKLVFTSVAGETDVRVGISNADGSGQALLTDSGSENGNAAWSPDGSKIVYTSERDGNPEVYVMNADGGGQTRLTNHDAADSFADWQQVPPCTVAAVIDGDTFDCTDGRRVRMLQIDAANLDQCGGGWAKAAQEFIFLQRGRTVRLEYDVTRTDGAGNHLAAPIWRGNDGADYNLSIVMVYVGLAKAATVGAGNTRYLDWANAAQTWAQVAQWNMWAPGKTYNGGC